MPGKKKKAASLKEFYKFIDVKPAVSYSQVAASAREARMSAKLAKAARARTGETVGMDPQDYEPQWVQNDSGRQVPVFVYDRANQIQDTTKSRNAFGKQISQFAYGPEEWTGPAFIVGSPIKRNETQQQVRDRIDDSMNKRRAYLAKQRKGDTFGAYITPNDMSRTKKGFQAKLQSQGCPVSLKPTQHRVFGGDVAVEENPALLKQRDARRRELRNQNTRGRAFNIVSNAKLTQPPDRPESPRSFFPARGRPHVHPQERDSNELLASHAIGRAKPTQSDVRARGYIVVGDRSLARPREYATDTEYFGRTEYNQVPKQRRYPQHIGRSHDIITGELVKETIRRKEQVSSYLARADPKPAVTAAQ